MAKEDTDEPELTADQVPGPEAGWVEIMEFALLFDGYARAGSFDECAAIAHDRRNETLGELRTCLFFEQRRWRHYGEDPDESGMKYIRELLAQIRRKLTARG